MHNLNHEICSMAHDTQRAKEFFSQMLAYTVTPKKLKEKLEKHLDKIQIFDMRDYDDYIEGHIPYAEHVPFEKFEEKFDHFSKDKINIVYGYSPLCQRGTKAAYMLASKGFPVKELLGGFMGWKKSCLDIVKNDTDDYKENW